MNDYQEASADLGNAVWMRRDRELGLSREALAGRLGWTVGGKGHRSRSGWSPKTLVRIERGERGLRSEVEYNLLARALDLTPGQLAGRIAAAGSVPHSGEASGLAAALGNVQDPEIRTVLTRIADDLAGLARILGGEPGPAARGSDPRGE